MSEGFTITDALAEALKEVAEAADRQLAMMGKGREPSPRLQEALDRARDLVPAIRAQESPRALR